MCRASGDMPAYCQFQNASFKQFTIWTVVTFPVALIKFTVNKSRVGIDKIQKKYRVMLAGSCMATVNKSRVGIDKIQKNIVFCQQDPVWPLKNLERYATVIDFFSSQHYISVYMVAG